MNYVLALLEYKFLFNFFMKFINLGGQPEEGHIYRDPVLDGPGGGHVRDLQG